MGLYEVHMLMSLLGFVIDIMFASFHVTGCMMILFNTIFYILVRYVSPRGPVCFSNAS